MDGRELAQEAGPITSKDPGATAPTLPDADGSVEMHGAAAKKLLPRETGHDIGMGSPVPLSAEAVGVITRLRNQKDQDEEDDDLRKKAMSDLVQSWMDRLQLISVIVSIFLARSYRI